MGAGRRLDAKELDGDAQKSYLLLARDRHIYVHSPTCKDKTRPQEDYMSPWVAEVGA
jgi:hypothetical protein